MTARLRWVNWVVDQLMIMLTTRISHSRFDT